MTEKIRDVVDHYTPIKKEDSGTHLKVTKKEGELQKRIDKFLLHAPNNRFNTLHNGTKEVIEEMKKEVLKIPNKIIHTFERERKSCLDSEFKDNVKSHKEYLKTGSGLVTPPTPREKMTCENSCPTEYGKLTCYYTPHVFDYETALEIKESLIKWLGEKEEK